ncbi:hypothetical protein BLA60_17090 [Actinophytocola xinjiangensis]|uniref:Uncharacterized protein n=1 Tax=Actinophytocola xinjiangensis TaxID=485602 RepID=A0A7Z1AXE1_9PSEU|nr:DUF6338 family protein [Actinophytocola xinjiangensis]OLF10161.1 hypothetical protein BLA60_17090 [Actinophytocola xinjiangensis]
MGQAPSTVLQLGMLALVVLPGITYQFLRERWRGPVPGERDLGERVLRSIAASILLDTLYLVVAGPALVRLAREIGARGWDGITDQARLVGLLGLLLFIVVPAGAAGGVTWWQRRGRRAARYRGTPTAWDSMFRDSGSCFVRVRLRDGAWAGGWYGTRSFATSYPQPAEIYLQTAWIMDRDGRFVRPIAHSGGLHVRASDVDVLELVLPSPTRPEEPR